MATRPPIVGLPTGGVGESSHRRSPPPSPPILAQPSSSEVGESSAYEKYHKFLKNYHEVRAVLCASRLHVDMLRGELVAARAALVVALQEADQAQEDKATVVSEAICQAAATTLAAAQLQLGEAVNVQVVEQGFPPGSKDVDIADLVESSSWPPTPS